MPWIEVTVNYKITTNTSQEINNANKANITRYICCAHPMRPKPKGS
jgi:hypothetical protein